MRGKIFGLLAVVFYALGVAEAFFSPMHLELPISQLENIALLGSGSACLIAFLMANGAAATSTTTRAPDAGRPSR